MADTFNALGFIQENSLTYTEIKKDYETFINALSEDEKLGFKTLFAGANGRILIDAISAKESAEIYHIITSREENYLQYCNRIDSAIAIAQSKGYNVKRGSNVKIRVTMTPTVNTNLSKFEPLCSVDDFSLIVTEDTQLISGEQISVDTYLGEVKEQSLIADSEDLLIFRFTAQNVSDQIMLLLNDEEVPVTTNILEMLDDKYFCISNAYSSVDAIYLNSRKDFIHRYGNGSKLTLKYIEYRNMPLSSIEVTSDYGVIDDLEQLSTVIRPEDTASVKVHAQMYAESENRIVARDDFQKVLEDFDSAIIDAKGHDYTPAVVEVTYLKKDGLLMSPNEFQDCYNYLYKRRAYGIPMCRITHPEIMLNLDVDVILQLNSGNTSNLNNIVRNVLSKYELSLGSLLDFSKIEESLESYKIIETARIVPHLTSFEAETLVPIGTVINPTVANGKVYVVRNLLNITGSEEPTWPTILDDTVVDNNIIWKCQQKAYATIPMWSAGASIVEGMTVTPTTSSNYQYICIGYTYETGATEPEWPTTIGSYVSDNQIQWMAVEKDPTADEWTANTIVEKGVVVNATSDTEVSYQAISYIPTTSDTEPTWSTTGTLFDDGNIQYVIMDKVRDNDNPSAYNIQLNWNQYIKFNESVVVV